MALWVWFVKRSYLNHMSNVKHQILKIMNKQDQWLERLVRNYSIPTEEKKEKRGVLNEEQLKNLKNGKS